MKTLLSMWRGSVPNPVRIADVATRIAAERGVTVADLKSPARTAPLARARLAAFAACRAETGRSLPQIGAFFGGRHPTTVLQGARRHGELERAGR